ncbi:MAG: methylmalonyl Co-A mutase-associated GTPase MeaB [bacterium]
MRANADYREVLDRMLGGDKLALARMITYVENDAPFVPKVLEAIYPRTGRCYSLGVTGPPGAGKSTLVDKLIPRMRSEGKTVGVVAVDPSSPFTGGAVLGDRIRMQRHALDDGVFIRSLGTRGTHGGLSRATRDVLRLLDAFGLDVVIIETVGVGQTELDIVDVADTTMVVLVPESGDTIQTMKAGLMEIAEIFVVNKADRQGADRILTELKSMVELGERRDPGWKIPVLLCQANRDEGTDKLYQTMSEHRAYRAEKAGHKSETGEHRRKELMEILSHRFLKSVEELESGDEGFRKVLARGEEADANPYQVASSILGDEKLLRQLLGRA